MRICESSPKMRLRQFLFGSICALPVVLLAGCGAPSPYYGARTIVVAPSAESEPSTHYIYSTVNSTSTIHSTSQSDIHIYSNHPLTGSAPPSSGPTQEEEGTLYQQNQDYQHQLQNAQDEQNRENQQVDQPVIPQLGQPTDQPEAQPASDEPPPHPPRPSPRLSPTGGDRLRTCLDRDAPHSARAGDAGARSRHRWPAHPQLAPRRHGMERRRLRAYARTVARTAGRSGWLVRAPRRRHRPAARACSALETPQ
jgi:hypothetical protein